MAGARHRGRPEGAEVSVPMQEHPGGATNAVSHFIANADLSDVPAAGWEMARKAIADTFACILSGAASDLREPLLAYLAEAAGGGCRVLGTGLMASPQDAALVNGSFAAALDFDDLMSPMHPSAMVVAALCSALGGATQGRRFLEAYVVGIEVGAKLSLALGPAHPKRGFHATATLGRFSAFAALARIKALPVDRIKRGLALVASQTGGLLCQLGTMGKPLHSGLAARVAIDAERMCSLGVTANDAVLEARRGLFEAYGGEGSDSSRLAGSLGNPWAVFEPGSTLKRFASSVAGHRAIVAVLQLKAQGLTADNLLKLDCAVAPGALRPMLYPLPSDGLQSKFSMPYAIAAALLDEPLTIASFSTAAARRPRIAALLDRITTWEDPQQAVEDPVSANRSWGYRGYNRLTAQLTDGRTLTCRVDAPPGDKHNPLSWDDLRTKFIDCAACVGIAEQRAGATFGTLRSVDACDDLRSVLAALQTESAA